MKYTLSLFVVLIIIVLAVSKFSPTIYEVRFDYANGEVVEVRDAEGHKVNETIETLKKKGIMYEIVYVQPKTMGN
jgi:hypothetical protein